ncbi:hypothetical protein FGIG_06388 [Fasciola gigantica]|uniref:Uncharacterized protein n=1 Tax=Fasciola gigantica TaxID=46835 RepID=A0A504YRF3_FASGI|nr:hypothetical protein FGIG_06388 [Fasciola gigantica]
MLGLSTTGISDPETKDDFLLNMPTFLQAALFRVRKLEACGEALRQLPNETIAAYNPLFSSRNRAASHQSHTRGRSLTAVTTENSDRGPITVDTTQLCSAPVSPSIVLCPYPLFH